RPGEGTRLRRRTTTPARPAGAAAAAPTGPATPAAPATAGPGPGGYGRAGRHHRPSSTKNQLSKAAPPAPEPEVHGPIPEGGSSQSSGGSPGSPWMSGTRPPTFVPSTG